MAQIELSPGPPIDYNYRISLPVRKIATSSDVIEGGLEGALQIRRTFRRRIAQQRHEPSAEVLDSPECV
jgi:hypothetical protein